MRMFRMQIPSIGLQQRGLKTLSRLCAPVFVVSLRQTAAVNEAVSTGLALSLDLGLQDLPGLCGMGDTSVMRMYQYLPYENDSDCGSDGDHDQSGSGCNDRATNGDCGPAMHEEVCYFSLGLRVPCMHRKHSMLYLVLMYYEKYEVLVSLAGKE